MSIKFLDMFAGIGGFRSRLEAIGGFECVGYCEIDKYAKQAYEAMYDTGGELYFDDARKIVPEQLPDFDLLLGGFGGHSGLYLIENTENFGLPIKSKTKDGYQIAYPGDSIDTAFSGENSRRGRVGSQIAHTLTTSATQAVFYLLPERENDRISHRPLTQSVKPVGRHESNEMDTRVHFIDLNPDPKLTEIARCITARHDSGISNHKAEYSGVFVESTNITEDEKFAVAFVEPNGEVHIGRIRKLTPRECWRLQGFTDDQFDKAKATGLSDSRLYKMSGNAVTVNVISAIGEIIKKVDSKN